MGQWGCFWETGTGHSRRRRAHPRLRVQYLRRQPTSKADLAVASLGGSVQSGQLPSAWVLLAETQTATATATGISPEGTGTHQVEASYPGDGNYSASVSGTTGLTAANIQASLSTTSISFGSEEVGDSTTAQAVTLTNSGTVAMAIGSIKLTGADTSSFVTSNNCGTSLAAGAKCTIGVRFAPETTATFTASITLTDNAPNSPQNVALSGPGATTPTASLSLSATNASFGSWYVGTSSEPQGVTVTNTSAVTLYFSSIKLAGANPASFKTSNTCGASIGAGATCQIGVDFSPMVPGPLTASVTLTDNTSTSPQSITLTGTGVGATVTLSSTSVSFGNMAAGYSTEVQTVSLKNNGTLPLTINSIQLTGANAGSFAESNNCGASLQAFGTATCDINVRFAPNAAGAASAAVTLTDNAANSPQTIALSGTGVTAAAGSLSLSSTSLSFGTEEVGSSTAAQGVTVTNTSSTAVLYFKSIVLSGANAASFVTSNTCGASIAAGAACKIGARFAPATTGPLTATITLTDSASTSPQVITLSGTGTN